MLGFLSNEKCGLGLNIVRWRDMMQQDSGVFPRLGPRLALLDVIEVGKVHVPHTSVDCIPDQLGV